MDEGELAVIRRSSWLAETPPEFANALTQNLRSFSLTPGMRVSEAGDQSISVWIVLEGLLQLEAAVVRNDPSPGDFVMSGEWFGASTLYSTDDAKIDAVAVRPSRIAALPHDDALEIVRSDPEAWRWLGLLSARNADAANVINSLLMMRKPRQRCIAILVRLFERRQSNGEPADIMINHSDLGALSNLSRSVIAEILQELEAKKTIARGYGRIHVLNPEKLRAELE